MYLDNYNSEIKNHYFAKLNNLVTSKTMSQADAIISLAEQLVPKLFGGRTANVFNVISLAMAAVEKYAQTNSLGSGSKLQAALNAIPAIIDLLVSLNYITANEATSLKAQLASLGSLQTDFINAAAFLTNNPELLQLEQVVKAKFGCC